MVQILEHSKLIIDHLLIALDYLFQYDLDSNFSAVDIGLSDNTICTRSERLSESILCPGFGERKWWCWWRCQPRIGRGFKSRNGGKERGNGLFVVTVGLAMQLVDHGCD